MQIDLGKTGNDLYFGWQQKPGANFNHQQVFYTNMSGEPKTVIDISAGIVLDTTEMRTGWQNNESSKWQFNESVAHMAQKPGEDWKKGFSIPVAIGEGRIALWMSSGATAWSTLTYLGAQLADCPTEGHVPLVVYEGPSEGKYEAKTWVWPKLKVQQWMPRPESLSVRNAIEIDMGQPAPSAPPAPPNVWQPPAPKPIAPPPPAPPLVQAGEHYSAPPPPPAPQGETTKNFF
jgi:hypothetical protein